MLLVVCSDGEWSEGIHIVWEIGKSYSGALPAGKGVLSSMPNLILAGYRRLNGDRDRVTRELLLLY